MAGQRDVNWSDEHEAGAAIRRIPSLTPTEREDMAETVTAALERETDITRKLKLGAKVKGLVEGVAAGGLKGLFSAAVRAISG